MKSSWLRSSWVAGSVLLIQLGSVSAFADDSTQSSGFFASLRGVFSALFGSQNSTSSDAAPTSSRDVDERDLQSQAEEAPPNSLSSPFATSSSVPALQSEPRVEQLPVAQEETGMSSQVNAQPSGVPIASVAVAEYFAPIVFAKRAGASPAVFRPHERFDLNDPESFARLQDALAEDKQANALITAVLNETGKSSLSKLVTFKIPQNPFQNGVSMISTDRATPDAVLAGWPALDSGGLLMADPNPSDRLHVTVELNPKAEMIELYSTIIHELTHVQGSLLRMRSESINEILNFKDAQSYSVWNIERQGGELDAFTAEISAVIRYRNRYNLPYEAFFTPRYERYFDMKTGELVNRRGLEESIAGKGNGLAYYATGIDKFVQLMQQELRYNETLLQQLKSSPSYDSRADVREEARRLEARLQRIHSQYGSILN